MSQTKLIMRQTNICTWQILTESGILLLDDIKLGLRAEAEDFIKRYVSSYPSWDYEVKGMEDGSQDD